MYAVWSISLSDSLELDPQEAIIAWYSFFLDRAFYFSFFSFSVLSILLFVPSQFFLFSTQFSTMDSPWSNGIFSHTYRNHSVIYCWTNIYYLFHSCYLPCRNFLSFWWWMPLVFHLGVNHHSHMIPCLMPQPLFLLSLWWSYLSHKFLNFLLIHQVLWWWGPLIIL